VIRQLVYHVLLVEVNALHVRLAISLTELVVLKMKEIACNGVPQDNAHYVLIVNKKKKI
jgi:hypothetical protein